MVVNGNNPEPSEAEHLGPAVVPGRPSVHLGAFHAHSGWYFHRNDDGTVAIEVAQSAKADAPRLVMAIFDADTWASIVAAVSTGGETGDRWRQAREFHAGPIPASDG